MKGRKIILVSAGILISLSLAGCKNQTHSSSGKETSTVQSNNESATQSTSSSQTSSYSESNERGFSSNEWMLMGYLVYKNKNVSNIDSTINTIMNDFSSGSLHAERISEDSYRLANQYGSVDIQVNSANVVVTNDGITRTSKLELEKIFSGKTAEVKKMVKYTATADNGNSQDYNEWKTGIPDNIIGEYTNYRNEDEQYHMTQIAICDIRYDTIVSWSSGMATHYSSNIRYKKLNENKYKFEFNVRTVGNILSATPED